MKSPYPKPRLHAVEMYRLPGKCLAPSHITALENFKSEFIPVSRRIPGAGQVAQYGRFRKFETEGYWGSLMNFPAHLS